jgi:3-(3-hydroxy-phenyl)propionate hydroxylase
MTDRGRRPATTRHAPEKQMSRPSATSDRIYVVGAGPVGAVMTLALARRGIPVTLVESNPGPVDDQRAATVHPPTIEMLEALGIEKDGWETGLKSPLFHFWDRVSASQSSTWGC